MEQKLFHFLFFFVYLVKEIRFFIPVRVII